MDACRTRQCFEEMSPRNQKHFLLNWKIFAMIFLGKARFSQTILPKLAVFRKSPKLRILFRLGVLKLSQRRDFLFWKQLSLNLSSLRQVDLPSAHFCLWLSVRSFRARWKNSSFHL